MYSRPYPRPFVRATSPVRSRRAAAATLPQRMRKLVRGYRLAFGLALALSLVSHGLLWLVGPEADPQRPQPILGFEGPTRIVAIQVVDTDSEQEALAEQRRRAGALVATEIRTEDEERRSPSPRDPFETERNESAQRAETPYYVLEAPPTIAEADPETPIRFELREDLSIGTVQSASARSLQIKLLWVVRPEYPAYARRNGIEGLVRLEAEVGITGKVLDVHVLETPDGGLALAASRSLLLWEFQPLEVNGRLRKFRVVVPFRFRLLG